MNSVSLVNNISDIERNNKVVSSDVIHNSNNNKKNNAVNKKQLRRSSRKTESDIKNLTREDSSRRSKLRNSCKI